MSEENDLVQRLRDEARLSMDREEQLMLEAARCIEEMEEYGMTISELRSQADALVARLAKYESALLEIRENQGRGCYKIARQVLDDKQW